MAVKIGVLVPQGWHFDLEDIEGPEEQFEAMVRVGQEAERLGYDSIWVYDHFHTVPYAAVETNFECWISTAALARETSTVRIGQLVTCNSYRPPALLAKMASTVDVLSHGRLDFGIGAGWYEEEYLAYGYPFPDGPERLRMLGEALQIIHAMWTEPYATFEGRYYQVRGAINEPKGVQKPHPPIWIGGGGEKVTLRLVAQYGDACNVGGDLATIRHKLEVLRQHCETVGRDYDSVLKTMELYAVFGDRQEVDRVVADHARRTRKDEAFIRTWYPHHGDAEQIADQIGEYAAAGIQYFILNVPNAFEGGVIGRFADEVFPKLGL